MRITLLKAHIHAGKHYEAGDTLELEQPITQWLIEQCIARPERKPFVQSKITPIQAEEENSP